MRKGMAAFLDVEYVINRGVGVNNVSNTLFPNFCRDLISVWGRIILVVGKDSKEFGYDRVVQSIIGDLGIEVSDTIYIDDVKDLEPIYHVKRRFQLDLRSCKFHSDSRQLADLFMFADVPYADSGRGFL